MQMSELSAKWKVVRFFLECDFFRETPQLIIIADRANEQFYFDLQREDSVKSFEVICPKKQFDFLREDDNEWFLAAVITRLANLGSIAFFIEYTLSSSIGSETEYTDQTLIACLLYKLTTSPRDYEDLFIGVTRDFIKCAEQGSAKIRSW